MTEVSGKDKGPRATDQRAVTEVSRAIWSERGKPERITETLRRLNKESAFPIDELVGSST